MIAIASSTAADRRNDLDPGAARRASMLPGDAFALIEREPRSTLQSAPALRRGWRLTFRPRRPYRTDPLMGWKSGTDPLAHLILRFPDLGSAIRYAERHALPYQVRAEEFRRGERAETTS